MRGFLNTVFASVIVLTGILAGESSAADTAEMQTTIEALKVRLRDMERRLGEVETETEESGNDSLVKAIEEIKADAAKRPNLPNWMDGLKFYGDFRLRYQYEDFDGRSRKDRNRARFRVRFGFKKTWLDDQMEVGFRLASGSSSDATSTNQTFTGVFSEKNVWIDLAYAKYKPNWLKGLTVIGGKMKNPLFHTDLIWDSDVNPEGFAATYKTKLTDSIRPYATVGYFILSEVRDGHDTDLFAYQAGAEVTLFDCIKWNTAVTYYDYENVEETSAAAMFHNNNWTRKYQMLNVTSAAKFKAMGLPWKVYVDWAHNVGDRDKTAGFEDKNNAYAFGMKVGKNKKKGDWSASYKYAYIEPNAVPGGLNDSDFGTSNRKGHVFGAKYSLSKSLTLGGKVFWTQPVVGSTAEEDLLVQADLVWKF